MKLRLQNILTLLGMLVCLGCSQEKKFISSHDKMYLFRETLEPSEKRKLSLRSDEPIEIWTGVEYDQSDIRKVPDGGYMGALLTNSDNFMAVAGTGVATTFRPSNGKINLEVKNESDVRLVTLVYLEDHNISIFKKYNKDTPPNPSGPVR